MSSDTRKTEEVAKPKSKRLQKLADERASTIVRMQKEIEDNKMAKKEKEVHDGDVSDDDGFPTSSYVDMEAVRVNSDEEDGGEDEKDNVGDKEASATKDNWIVDDSQETLQGFPETAKKTAVPEVVTMDVTSDKAKTAKEDTTVILGLTSSGKKKDKVEPEANARSMRKRKKAERRASDEEEEEPEMKKRSKKTAGKGKKGKGKGKEASEDDEETADEEEVLEKTRNKGKKPQVVWEKKADEKSDKSSSRKRKSPSPPAEDPLQRKLTLTPTKSSKPGGGAAAKGGSGSAVKSSNGTTPMEDDCVIVETPTPKMPGSVNAGLVVAVSQGPAVASQVLPSKFDGKRSTDSSATSGTTDASSHGTSTTMGVPAAEKGTGSQAGVAMETKMDGVKTCSGCGESLGVDGSCAACDALRKKAGDQLAELNKAQTEQLNATAAAADAVKKEKEAKTPAAPKADSKKSMTPVKPTKKAFNNVVAATPDGWNPMRYSGTVVQLQKAAPVGTVASETMAGAIMKALNGDGRGNYRGLYGRIDEESIRNDPQHFTNGFCTAAIRTPIGKYYECGGRLKPLRNGTGYMDCFTHRGGPKVMRICLKDVSWIDGRVQERDAYDIACLFPELVFELVGKELYDRAHAALMANDDAGLQAAVDDMAAALRNGPACTKGFASSCSFGWVDGTPQPEGLQSIYLKPAIARQIEIIPEIKPGAAGMNSVSSNSAGSDSGAKGDMSGMRTKTGPNGNYAWVNGAGHSTAAATKTEALESDG